MAGWLSRTTSLFQQPRPTPEPFDVECDCGGKVIGQRGSTYLKPTCSHCERPVFVLPANVYPLPKPKPTAPKATDKQAPASKADRTSTNTLVSDVPSASPAKVAGKKPLSGTIPSSPVDSDSMLRREPRGPLFTPLRLITAAILCISILTGVGLWHRNLIETAKATVSVAADAGTAAIRELDFVKGAKELERARLAVDLLGRKDHTADEIRRLSREATVLANLASSSLTEFLHETLSNGKPGQTETLRMSSLDKNAWVIFDTTVIPANDGPNRFLVDAPMVLGNISVQIEIVSAALAPAAETGDEPQRVIFAAQLEELSSPRGDPLTAVLTLRGKTAFLWTSYDTYFAIGFRPFDSESEQQARTLLDRQLETRPPFETIP